MTETTSLPAPKADGIGEMIRTVVTTLLVVAVVRSLIFQPFVVPSASLTPTLLTGDYIFVPMFSYGYSHYALPFAPKLFRGRIFDSDPARGDVVVFVNPLTGEDWVKRFVGLPGDRIQMVHGILTINGEPSKRERIADYREQEWDDVSDRPVETMRYHYIETMPNGVRHEILGGPVSQPEDSLPQDNTEIYVVPQGHYFGMGDNRDNSADSRFPEALGYIPAENLIGRAENRLWSIEAGAHLWQFWRWPWTLRVSRFFGAIH